mgnify:CR=1 FL=1
MPEFKKSSGFRMKGPTFYGSAMRKSKHANPGITTTENMEAPSPNKALCPAPPSVKKKMEEPAPTKNIVKKLGKSIKKGVEKVKKGVKNVKKKVLSKVMEYDSKGLPSGDNKGDKTKTSRYFRNRKRLEKNLDKDETIVNSKVVKKPKKKLALKSSKTSKWKKALKRGATEGASEMYSHQGTKLPKSYTKKDKKFLYDQGEDVVSKSDKK